MKAFALFACFAITLAALAGSPTGKGGVPRRTIVMCDSDDAEKILHIRYGFRGVLEERKNDKYVRVQRLPRLVAKNADGSEIWDYDIGIISSEGFSADGKTASGAGIGCSGSVDVETKGSGIVLRVSLHWTQENDTGDFQKEWELPLENAKLSDGRFYAEIQVENKANHTSEPASPSRGGSS